MGATEPTRVLVVGAGAIGSFYGAILHRAGAEVSVVCRSDVGVVREGGFRIKSRPLGDLSFRPAQVHASVDEVERSPDYLLLCVKVLDGVDRAALIAPAVGPRTAIVLIENGIGIEREVAEAFPGNPLISALGMVGVSRTGPGEILHNHYGRLVLGDYPSGAGERARHLGALLDAGGVTGEVSEDVVTARWAKCLWNTAFNPLSVLGGGADTATMTGSESTDQLLRALMIEICAVAAADGHPLDEGLIDGYLERTRTFPGYRNSMALDYLNGRPLELDAILGNVLRIAAERGVEVPRLDTIYRSIRLLQDMQARDAEDADTGIAEQVQ
ncbi:2-dehydropantoate 2-reductase [Ectothiorhodospiraceae bacterium WFHF3C12]|nr:2-dehydropantoate 2-reductase [Ectothiorhodospiraceae bacterium WFHF3C12]